MKICCIDIGTNSVLCLLAKVNSKKQLTPLKFSAETTRLGKSLGKTSFLNTAAQKKTISVIKKLLSGTTADKYILAGTSALREAKNSKQFIEKIYNETGQKIKILSEKEEAQLAFDSVTHFLNPIPNKTIIADIGGGSTELIFCKNKKILKKISIPIGAVNITERFRNNITEADYFIKSKIHKKLKSFKKFNLISIGGTVTTLGAILKDQKKYNPDKVHGLTIPYEKVIHILNKLNSMSLRERKKILCFAPKRADIIVAGLCILKGIMEECDAKNFRICERGLVYGLALNYSTIKTDAPSAGK